MTTTNTYGRQVVVPLTNKSGGGVIAGDVVIVDTANNDAFTTTTSAASTGSIGIAQETIASNATGRVLLSGYAALINTTASVTRGNYGTTSTTVKKAVDAGAARIAGTFVQFLTGGTTPDGIVFNADLGAGTGVGTGSAGAVLAMGNGAVIWNAGTSFPGSKATNDRYFRTDLGLEAYWDGTRWLTTHLFSVSFPPTQFLNTFGTGAVNIGRLPVPYKGTYSIWGDSFDWLIVTGGTYSGSVYWSLIINWADVNDSDTQWGSTALDTKLDTAGISHNYSHHGSIGAVLNASASEIKARMDPSGSPAQLSYTTATLNYRLILT